MLVLALFLFQSLLQEPAVVQSTAPKHLTIVATVSADAAAPGSKVSLFLDITPRRGIHVYAPGAKDYLPIAVAMERHVGVKVDAVKFPPSDTMLFEGEKVPIYEKPFRLVQESTLDRSLKDGTTVTLHGTVKYQACDDKVCFIPASVPVSWTIAVKSGG